MYEATTDETDQPMHLWNLDLKIYERHWTIDICERFKRFDVYQMLEAVNHEMTIEKDTQHLIETEKEIWKRVFEQFIEQSMQVNSVSEDRFYLILKNKMRKSQMKELYDKFLWPKCSMSVYYQRIKRWIFPLEALKPVEKREFAVRSKLYAKELERYKQQPQPKPPREKFYWRIQKWYSKEEAIKIELNARQRKKKAEKELYVKAYTVKERRYKPDDYEIRITYHSDEAKVFKDEYERMIRDTEAKRNATDDIIESAELRKKLDKLIQEYALFISYNTNTNESL